MAKMTVNEERCNGCELCVTACPKKIVALDKSKINQKGFSPASVKEQEKCTGCAMCAVMCPTVAITVEK